MAKSKPRIFFLATFLTVTLALAMFPPAASAKPKFKVLQQVGGNLSGGLTLDADGNLYGANCATGPYEDGTIFELSRKDKWAMTVLHTFDGTDGACPNGGLIFDPEGNLYGTTGQGGQYRKGEVFEMTPGHISTGWSFTVLYAFCEQYGCPDGAPPNAGVVRDAQGNLYGTATGGGSNDGGVVYELSSGRGSWTYAVLHNFGPENGFGDGYLPTDALTFDKVGDLFGTTGGGGTYDLGTVFELRERAGGWDEDLLYSFCADGFPCTDGAGPTASVVFDKNGSLLGTAGGGKNRCGEANCGTVFQLTRKGGWHETVVHNFKEGAGGNYPSSDGGLASDPSGNLYGTTALGGLNACSGGCGVIYELKPEPHGGWRYLVLHQFNASDGGYPDGGLVMDSQGNLYGNAYTVVFEISP